MTTTQDIIRQSLDAAFKKSNVGSMKEIHDELQGHIESEWNSIPESVFVSEFLDLIVNGVQKGSDRLEKWIAVAGNLRFGVHVYKDDTRERLFTVPPMLDSSMISASPAGENQASIASVVANFDTLARARPAQAKAYFDKNMKEMLARKFCSPTSQYWKQYQAILDRYQKDPVTPTSQAVEKPVMTYNDDDILS